MPRPSKNKQEDGASIAEHARRLRAKPGWNPQSLSADQELPQALEQLQVTRRLSENSADQTDCADCQKLRHQSHDPQALCRRHYALVLGFET